MFKCNDRNVISTVKKILEKNEYWWRNGGFNVLAGSKNDPFD